MKNNCLNFEKPTATIISSNTIEEEIIGVNQLVNRYNGICNNLFLDKFLEENKKTIVGGGIALSSKHARDCIEDPIRTARFLKGIYKALLEAKERFKDEKITLLYAGCGPLGTLIIPLLHLFSSEKLEIIFLDIHQTSIDSVKKIIKKLKLKSYVKEYLVADATTYRHSSKHPLHMIITETMDKALTKEPQVEITRNLGKQLIDNGIFIPEKIEIERGYSFFAKEYVLNSKVDVIKLNNEKSTETEKIFSITSKMESINSFFYETDSIPIPTDFEKTPDICLYTSLQVFDDVYLNKAESYITNPVCVKSLYTLKKEKYKLQYSTKGIPNWKILEC